MSEYSLSDTPWLTQPADPGGAFLRGAQVGNQIAQTIQKARLLPFQMQAMQTENQSQLIDMHAKLQLQQDLMSDKAAFAEWTLNNPGATIADSTVPNFKTTQFQKFGIETMQQGGKMIAHQVQVADQLMKAKQAAEIFNEFGVNPVIGYDTTGTPIYDADTFKTYAPQLAKMRLNEANIGLKGTQADLNVTKADNLAAGGNESGKLPAAVITAASLTEAKTNFRLASDELANADTPEAQVAAQAKFTKAKDALESAQTVLHADPAIIAARQSAVDSRIAQAADRLGIERVRLANTLRESGVTLNQPAGATNALPTLTPTAKPNTAAVTTDNQKSLSSALTGMRQIDQIEPLINSGTIGPRAAVEDIVIDRGLANVFPELLNKDRVKSGVLLSSLQASVVKSLKSDSNITEDERKALNSQVPSPAQMLTSPARALEQLKTIQGTLVQRAVRNVINLHQPVPNEAVPYLTSSDLEEAIQAGLATPDQARNWYKLHHR